MEAPARGGDYLEAQFAGASTSMLRSLRLTISFLFKA